MAKTYKELVEEDFARQIEFNHIEDYHKLGYKGKGIVILNAEGAGDHREMTSKVIRDYAPEATLLEGNISAKTSGNTLEYCNVTLDGQTMSLETAVDKYSIKILTRSYAGSYPEILLRYYKDLQNRKGVIFFCSAGNDGSEGVTGVWAKDDTAIAVGAAKLKENGQIERMYYSSTGPELDFMCFMARGTGTSAASPALAAMTALLLQKYGDFNQKECVEILKSLCVDLGDTGRDNNTGYGLPVLPLTERLEILEESRGRNMNFTDVKETDWFYDDVNFCVENGLMQGDGDDTFNPERPVTRAEEATTTRRLYEKLLDKIEGRK